jgi:regulatory protein
LKRAADKSFDSAKQYAFLLLKFRLRGEQELCARLKKKKFPEEVIDRLIAFLKEKRFIDDEVFAKSWIEYRLKHTFGVRRIRQELLLKGISKEIIDSNITAAQENYSESSVVDELARGRLAKLKDIEPSKAKQRVYAYLLRRGFSHEIVMDTINKLCKPTF